MDHGVMHAHPLGASTGRKRGRHRLVAVGWRERERAEAVAVRGDALLDGLAQVLQQVDAISNLEGVGRSERSTLSC
ncbi:hypothetical protein ACIQI8_44055 [Streptomyces sp. NPDC092369]|uniref:hypothetical protein n=1 Tax=Streptomyces sp. NPDC092369 TaxID=3366015 RepID=UPI00382FA2A1